MVELMAATGSVKDVSEEKILIERKEKVLKFIKENYNLLSYVILAIIVWVAVKIRTSNLPGLKDVTTNDWTLGPDLDPFLFLRWAQYIYEHGNLMAHDVMRYVPLGFNTAEELALHSYMIVWFHKIAVLFGSDSLTLSAVLYPAFMFGFAMIAFFFLTRKIFIKSLGDIQTNIIALVATFFLSVIPALLPRTIAGIPEKEAGALPFMFLAFYFFLLAWESKGKYSGYVWAVLAGASTGVMSLVWGGSIYVYSSITLAVFIAFVLGQIDRPRTISFGLWIFTGLGCIIFLSKRTSLSAFIGSVFTGAPLFLFVLLVVDLLVSKFIVKEKIKSNYIKKVPHHFISIAITFVIAILIASLIFGPSFVINKTSELKNILVTPVIDRINLTVAENKQPFFKEWESNFGPHVREIALSFWLFFFGSIHLFYFALRHVPDRIKLTLVYALFLICLIFSRYSESSTFNGTSLASLLFYALGPLVFVIVAGHYYIKYYNHEEKKDKISSIEFDLIFLLAFFVVTLISARSAVRLIMMLVPSASIIVGYFAVAPAFNAYKSKDSFWKKVWIGLAMLIIVITIFSGYTFYKAMKEAAPQNVPSIYTQQWQKAMSWVRTETPQNAVFGHWWDYGYWVQSIGERATVLDGGNAISYWNHLMGRYALTGPDEREALEFLYAHNTTHFLIDSTDIGKYSAFSSIGSDINYDRASYIPAFVRDDSQVQEKKNSTITVYAGGAGLDGDIIYEENGTKIFLPSGAAGLGAILVEKNREDRIISNPQGIFVYEGRQYVLPFRYAYDGEFRDFGRGIEAGIFLMPSAEQQGNSVNIKQDGALLYLSSRTVKSQLARLYLYKQETEYFKLAHSEDDFFVAQIKAQGAQIENDLLFFGGVRGPIRIWEISYPKDIEFKEEYIQRDYPDRRLLWGE